jgi:hypothetical protein
MVPPDNQNGAQAAKLKEAGNRVLELNGFSSNVAKTPG